jgi:hypothetical protein
MAWGTWQECGPVTGHRHPDWMMYLIQESKHNRDVLSIHNMVIDIKTTFTYYNHERDAP